MRFVTASFALKLPAFKQQIIPHHYWLKLRFRTDTKYKFAEPKHEAQKCTDPKKPHQAWANRIWLTGGVAAAAGLLYTYWDIVAYFYDSYYGILDKKLLKYN
jgi:hypothetical protein